MMILKNLTTIFTFFIISSCGFAAWGEEVSFESDVKIKREGQSEFSDVKANEIVKLGSGEAILVSVQQGLPMLIYSAKDANAKLRVPNSTIDTFAKEQIRPQLEAATSEIVNAIQKTQLYLQHREYDQALATITPIRAKYPTISSVLFVSASANYLTNHKSNAIDDVKKGLAIEPNDEAAQKLLERLRGTK